MPGHARRDFPFQRLDRLIGVCACAAPEDGRDPRERFAGEFHRSQRVFDVRRVRIVGDLLDLRLMGSDGYLESGRKRGILECGEIRQAVRPGPVRQRKIDGSGFLHGVSGSLEEQSPCDVSAGGWRRNGRS